MLVMSVLLEHNCVMVSTEDLDPGLPGMAITKTGSQIDRTLEGYTVPIDLRVGPRDS
jgi:hypothetical protein